MDDEPLVPWREISALSLDRAEALEAERDDLRVEVEQLKTANELWAVSLEGARKGYLDALGDAQAEVERLRAAAGLVKDECVQCRFNNCHTHMCDGPVGWCRQCLTERLPEDSNVEVERLRAALDPAHAAEVAMLFHDTYERLAPTFGYETREETRQFDPTSPNGALMIAVAASVLMA